MYHPGRRGIAPVALAAAFGLGLPASWIAETVQDFDLDGSGTLWEPANLGPLPACPPAVLSGGPAGEGRQLRLAYGQRIVAGCPLADPPAGENVNSNSIAFELTDPTPWSEIVADFDLRMTPDTGRADGLGFALLDTGAHGSSGPVFPSLPPFVAEEPNFAGSLGIGFDIFESTDLDDLDANHVSVHFNGSRLTEVSLGDLSDLAGGQWLHVRVHLHAQAGASEVTVSLTPCGSEPKVLIDRFPVPGLEPYEARAYFAARSGGLTASFDLDNVRIRFSSSEPDLVSLPASELAVVEGPGAVDVSVRRSGSAGTVTVELATEARSATAGADYVSTAETVTFAPGETVQTVSIPILDDVLTEGPETFRVSLSSPTGGASLGGPVTATVRIVDDEVARVEGSWSRVLCWPAVPIHLHLLPTGKVLFWGRTGDDEVLPDEVSERGPPRGPEPGFDRIRLWDPSSGELTVPALPPHDIFCSGHSFLTDGRLLVTGGNIKDGAGLPHATAYDPYRNTWDSYPNMNAGRWYPTNVTQGDGTVAVESGSYEVAPDVVVVNTLPQVLDTVSRTWRDLTAAEVERPPIADLYPRLFLAPDGRLFKAGPDQDSWYLETTGAGHWVPGPLSSWPAPRTYGPAVIFDGKVLLVGGGDPPTTRVDLIDLGEPSPLWQGSGDLEFPRRHHNATLLPDGSVLVTGGTSSAGFNDASAAVRFAELWNPATGVWTLLAPMSTLRNYHSAAVLLPDARVLVAGGGQPNATGDFDHQDAEIFLPPYLFRGTRPTLTSATPAVDYGEPIEVVTPDAASIVRVTLVRPGSATHAFDQSQRLVTASFVPVAGGLEVSFPSSPNLVPPGPYMLFLVNAEGVPSQARIVFVRPPMFSDDFETGDLSRWSAVVP